MTLYTSLSHDIQSLKIRTSKLIAYAQHSSHKHTQTFHQLVTVGIVVHHLYHPIIKPLNCHLLYKLKLPFLCENLYDEQPIDADLVLIVHL